MDLIIGGIYQGKLDFAKEKYALCDDAIFDCAGKSEIEFSKKCINNCGEFALCAVREGKNSIEYFKEHRAEWQGSVIIFRDIFCGVVPIEKEERLWREEAGRLLSYLSDNAESVTRLFCGIPERIK